MNLITAQISFTETHLTPVYIPKEHFHFFVGAIQQILFADGLLEEHQSAWPDRHQFLNLSITPFDCSLIAPTYLVDQYLRNPVEQFNSIAQSSKASIPLVEISNDEYVAIQVEGQGFDPAQRVLELTSGLAMANM